MLLETDPTLLEPDWRESVFTVRGLHLHVVEAGRVGDPLLVLLHGFPEFWWGWRHQISELAAAGHHVVVPDLRGYNGSEAPADVTAYRLDVLVEDVLGLVDAHGAERVDVVGHDWGAVIAWELAARHPDRVRRLVALAGPHPGTLTRSVIAHPTQALRSTYAGLFQLPWLPEVALRARGFAALRTAMRSTSEPGTFSEGDLDRYALAWARPSSLTGMLNYYRALRHGRPVLSAATVVPPTLVLWGEHDRFLERHVGEIGVSHCVDGRFLVIEGSTHWLHHEQPERVNAEVLAFLGETT